MRFPGSLFDEGACFLCPLDTPKTAGDGRYESDDCVLIRALRIIIYAHKIEIDGFHLLNLFILPCSLLNPTSKGMTSPSPPPSLPSQRGREMVASLPVLLLLW